MISLGFLFVFQIPPNEHWRELQAGTAKSHWSKRSPKNTILLMQVDQVRGTGGGPTGRVEGVFGFMQDGKQMWASRRGKQNCIEDIYKEIQMEHAEDSERKGGRLTLADGGLGFLLVIVVWWLCSLRHPRTGQTRMRAQVSSISHLCSRACGLGIKVFGLSGLEKHSQQLHPHTP